MPMQKILFVALCLFGCLATSALFAQTSGPTAAPPSIQSLQGTVSSCSPGGQSSRICNDDFRSCTDTCNQDINAGIDPTICSSRCCTYFNACMLVHQCITTPTQCD